LPNKFCTGFRANDDKLKGLPEKSGTRNNLPENLVEPEEAYKDKCLNHTQKEQHFE